jgi:hypothetical protein
LARTNQDAKVRSTAIADMNPMRILCRFFTRPSAIELGRCTDWFEYSKNCAATDQPHSKYLPHTWFGESVGHFEGDTLVVDTLGQNDKTYTDHFFTPHSDKIHVIERYKVSADHKPMQVQISVDDPDVFTMPWSAEATYRADMTPYEEVVCAENNRGFDSYPISIPTAAKPDF